MNWVRLAELLLLPPGCLLGLAGVGLLLLVLRRTRAGSCFLVLGLCPLYLLSTPWVAGALLVGLDRYPELAPGEEVTPAGAVVVLGAGHEAGGQRGGVPRISEESVERLVYGATLSLELGVPLLLSGERVAEGGVSMLAERFELTPRWLEDESRNTWQNARLSAELLRADGIRGVYLVTHYYHLPRAVAAFAGTGLGVVPAPMGFAPPRSSGEGVAALLPRAGSLRLSRAAVHEILGRLWYRLRYGV